MAIAFAHTENLSNSSYHCTNTGCDRNAPLLVIADGLYVAKLFQTLENMCHNPKD